jgi:hypothetical protein
VSDSGGERSVREAVLGAGGVVSPPAVTATTLTDKKLRVLRSVMVDIVTYGNRAWQSDSSPARELRITCKHVPVYLLIVVITYGADVVLERLGYMLPDPFGLLLHVSPGLLLLFMPLTPFLFALVGTYYDLREYIDERRIRQQRLRTRVRNIEDRKDDGRAGSS